MTEYAEKNTCISGIGQSVINRVPNEYPFELAVTACQAAIEDAGLTAEDIDGVSCWPDTEVGTGQGLGSASIADMVATLGLSIRWHSSANMAAQLSPIMNAISAIAAGYCRHVLCWRAVGERTAARFASAAAGKGGSPLFRATGYMEYMMPYWPMSAAIWCGIHASTHMHKFGITREQFSAVPITQRASAAFNDKAIYREPLTLDTYLSGRMISTPFSIFDCDVPCDGATAVIVSRLDAAPDLRQGPIVIEAIGAGTGDRLDTWLCRSDYPKMAMHDAARHMWARTDLTPKDVDTAHLYDGFTYLALLWLEALGFCEEGESGAFVEGGSRISLSGELPLNTNGGQLSEGRMHGFGHLFEACLQLRGDAGPRQVDHVEVSAVGNAGGSLGGALLLRRM